MENCVWLKGHRRRRLPSISVLSAAAMTSYRSGPFARTTRLLANPDVATDKSVTTSSPSRRSLVYCFTVLCTVMLTSSMDPLAQDFILRSTSATASTHEYPSTTDTASGRIQTFGGIWAEAASPVLPADRSGIVAPVAATQITETGPFRAAGNAVPSGVRGSPLPMLVRRPYMTDHPEMVRFPLSVEADLTDESFEAVEKISLEIARVMRQQQQRQRRRERQEYLSGERKPPVVVKKSHVSAAAGKDKHERGGTADTNEAAARGVARGRSPSGQYKFTESVADILPPDGPWNESTLDDHVDEDDETAALNEEESQSGTGGSGSRLIVGLTEITFPEMRKKNRSVADPQKGKVVESLNHSPVNASPLQELEEQATRGAPGSGDVSDQAEDTADENSDERGESLSHKEAVQEANQRLRLDQLQDLGIIKSVKVLENVGLVVLEFRDNLTEEEIKETIKTLWQRNRSTWLIEPDSEVVFRGRDSFERGEFVPVVPTEEERMAGGEHKEDQTLADALGTDAFLPGQEPELQPYHQQQRVQQEEVPQRSMRANESLKRNQEFAVPKGEGNTLEMPVAPVLHNEGDAVQTHVSRMREQKQHRGHTAPRKMGNRFANNPIFDAHRTNAGAEVAGKGKRHLQELEERKAIQITQTQEKASSTAGGRRLTPTSSVPLARSSRRPYSARTSFSGGNTQRATSESERGLKVAEQQTRQEAIIPGKSRSTTYAVTVSQESDADPSPAAFSDFLTDAHLHGREATAEDTMSPTLSSRSSPSLLKPHMGIVPLSLYDAAQEAVREALQENAGFRSLETSSRSAECEKCLKALAACERRPEFAKRNVDKGNPDTDSTYSNRRSTASIHSTSTSDSSPSKQTCTEESSPSPVTRPRQKQTSSVRRWVSRTEETGGTETEEERAALAVGPTDAARPIILTAEDPVFADKRSAAEEAPSVEENRADVVAEDDPSDGEMGNSAHRRLVFSSSPMPVSEKHLPNDQYFSRQWAYHGPRVNVRAVEAWNLVYKHRLTSQRRREGRARPIKHKTSSSTAQAGKVEPIIVAVIDTGIDYTHEDLRTQMWVNEGEIPDNGIDDDGNGYVDDYRGYDFEKDKSDPMDYSGHGTHVAGIIAAAANNKRGITGVNWEAKLMPLKFVARSAAAAEAIDYSLRMGAKISTNSWGYASPSEGLKMAIQRTAAKGQLFVSAVDNAGKDNTYTPDFPPNWGYDKRTNKGARNILRVANMTAEGGVAGTSNFGPNNVDVVAPGTDIISTVPLRKFPEGYGYKTGTSMATPLVAGIAAMVWSANPAMTAGEVRDCIIRTSTRLRSLEGFVIAGNVNAYAAVLDVLGPPNEHPTDLKEEKNPGLSHPGIEAAAAASTPAALAAAAAGNRYFYGEPVATGLVNGAIFPSEEAFFQHISQSHPYYTPVAVVGEHAHEFSEPPATTAGKHEPAATAGPAASSSVSSLVSSLTSLLGPLNKLLPLS